MAVGMDGLLGDNEHYVKRKTEVKRMKMSASILKHHHHVPLDRKLTRMGRLSLRAEREATRLIMLVGAKGSNTLEEVEEEDGLAYCAGNGSDTRRIPAQAGAAAWAAGSTAGGMPRLILCGTVFLTMVMQSIMGQTERQRVQPVQSSVT